MTILALNGSNSPQSIHGRLLALAASLTDVDVPVVSVGDHEAPLYSVVREQSEGIPQTLRELQARIQDADAVILASPEHNGMVTAALKNTIDWLSRAGHMEFLPKPLALVSASPGKTGGRNSLATLAGLVPWWGASLVGTLSIGGFYDAFDSETGTLRDAAQQAELADLLQALVAAASAPTAA